MTSEDGLRDRRDRDVDPWAPADRAPTPQGPRRRGLLVAALSLFALGVLFVVLAVAVPLVTGRPAPTALYLAAMAFTPLGFLLTLLYALLGSRPPRRRPDETRL